MWVWGCDRPKRAELHIYSDPDKGIPILSLRSKPERAMASGENRNSRVVRGSLGKSGNLYRTFYAQRFAIALNPVNLM
ncbi:hypothetical protein [Leptolyngbya sp. FACHB-17]|uniref:hypothetical protein n=1 Tax=unclassified Leptolyngbya TaxID=2650499 RepID=UPI00167FF4C8|nr:hypothetical protein [Leptolyngbya sp. FACHB-17]MBD2079933.1 hypothetical protein [Leptolyngbya sp. FACHB-17]